MIADNSFAETYFSLATTNEGVTWKIHRFDDRGVTQIASIADCTEMNAHLIVNALNGACSHEAHRVHRQLQRARSIIHDLLHFCEWRLQEPHDLDENDLRELLFRSGLYLERYELDLCESDGGPEIS